MNKHEELIERVMDVPCYTEEDAKALAAIADELEAQAREIEGLRKQDDALIRQMMEALKQFQYRACESIHPDFVDEAITAAQVRLGEKT